MDTKKCMVCGEEKLLMDFFYKGKDSKCKVCRLDYNRSRYAETIAPGRKKYTYRAVNEKVCKECGATKPVSEFTRNRPTGNGPSAYKNECKSCKRLLRDRVKESERGVGYRQQNADKRREAKRRYLSNPENLEKSRAYAREYYKSNPHRHRVRVLAKYGLDEEGYDALLQQQRGGCAICGVKDNGRNANFVIDHDHITGRVRALLCTQCNAGLGNYRDNPDLMLRAAQYLKN
jgi:hypothetical protein